MLPFTYAIRNLVRRPGRCVQLILGSGLVVLLLMLAASLNRGMNRVLIASGSPQNVILGEEESEEDKAWKMWKQRFRMEKCWKA